MALLYKESKSCPGKKYSIYSSLKLEQLVSSKISGSGYFIGENICFNENS
jgi:hypothetical protein